MPLIILVSPGFLTDFSELNLFRTPRTLKSSREFGTFRTLAAEGLCLQESVAIFGKT